MSECRVFPTCISTGTISEITCRFFPSLNCQSNLTLESFPKLLPVCADCNRLYFLFSPTTVALQNACLHVLNVHFQGHTFIMACNILISLQRVVKSHKNPDLCCKQGDPPASCSVLFSFQQVWNLENRFAYEYFTVRVHPIYF